MKRKGIEERKGIEKRKWRKDTDWTKRKKWWIKKKNTIWLKETQKKERKKESINYGEEEFKQNEDQGSVEWMNK